MRTKNLTVKNKSIADSFEDLVKIQCANGNWNYDPYMHGMANGMILALHMMRRKEWTPNYLKSPKKWLKDIKFKGKPAVCTQTANQTRKKGKIKCDCKYLNNGKCVCDKCQRKKGREK